MRSTTLLPSLALAGTTLAAQQGTLGFSLGTKLPDGSCKYQSDYEADFRAIRSATGSTIVRGYSASDCNTAQEILPAAAAENFKVVLGVWPDVDESFEADTDALKEWVPKFTEQVYAVTVGSEALYRGNFTGQELSDKIMQVKDMMPRGVKVGTADSWNKFADGTADAVIRNGVDIVLANAFAYWQGDNVGSGAEYTFFDDVQQALGHIQEVSGSLDGIEFWNGETGWPTDGGSDYNDAEAGTENAAAFYADAVCGMLDWGVNVFYFEAFDEPWKPESVGEDGTAAVETTWGAMTADRERKPGFPLRCQAKGGAERKI
ncbi:hypothetical protein MBLNU230_g7629t1 [Neophaeotheca triangularis]